MHISKITINNYKSFSNLEIVCNESFNIIIGENNIGKSSIFEALLLWKQCYDRSTLSKQTGFYKQSSKRYLRYEDLEFLRVTEDRDLFNKFDDNHKAVTISLQINYSGIDYNLGFTIICPINPSNTYFRIQYVCENDFERFATAFPGRVSEAIFIYKTQPISSIHSNEPYMNNGQVLKKISKGKSYEVLRNKLTKRPTITEKVSSDLSNVFEQKISLRTVSSRSNDEYIKLLVDNDSNSKEIHLQGSGFLQIAEIFSSIEYFESALNIILLDEPDSHIHTKILSNLVGTLKQESKNNQIFIISHNEKFIDYTDSTGELYFLNSKVKSETELLEPINHSLKNYMKEELGNILTSLEEFNTVERVVFVEGKNDKTFWSALTKKYCEINSLDKPNLFFIYVNGKDEIERKVSHFLSMSKQIKDIKKVAVIYDKDFSTLESHKITKTKIKNLIHADDKYVLSYTGYCLESTYFTELNKLSHIISRISGKQDEEIMRIIKIELHQLKENLSNLTSDIYKLLKKAFKTQQNNRKELRNLEFDDIVTDFVNTDITYALNKDMVNKILEKVAINPLIEDVVIHMGLLEQDYLSNIKTNQDIYQSHINIVREIIK